MKLGSFIRVRDRICLNCNKISIINYTTLLSRRRLFVLRNHCINLYIKMYINYINNLLTKCIASVQKTANLICSFLVGRI